MRASWPGVGLLLLLLAAATYSRADPDLWGHLRYGLDALDARALTADDPYSFTQDTPWVNHEWFSEVQTAVAYRLGGSAGLALLKGVLVFATFALMWMALDGARLAARVPIMVLAAVGTVHMTSAVRPQVWTFLAMAILCRVLAARRPEERRWLPVLFAVWANVHGGWVVGLGVLGAWAAAEVWSSRAALRSWLWLVPASTAATLITPYGWRLWEFVFRTVRLERDIAEWQPTWAMDSATWLPWAVTLVAAAWAVPRLKGHRLPAIVVLAMLAWSSFWVMRLGSLFLEATVLLLAPVVVRRWPAAPTALPATRSRAESVASAYLFALFVSAAAWVGSHSLTCLPILGENAPEASPVRMLSGASGRIVTFFDWGQYALWHLGPDLKVSMDGRRETVYTDARLGEHDAIVRGDAAGFDTLARWRAEYAWLPATSVDTRAWLAGHGYRIEFVSDRSFVAVRDDLPTLPVVAGTGSATRCFPG